MSESRSLRHEDLMFKRKHQLTRRSHTNTTNNTNNANTANKQTKKKQTKKFSSQKRQILIFEALKKIPKKTYTKSGQVELANNDD